MTPKEYGEMVGLIETWWGPSSPWQEADNYGLFRDLDTEPTFETLTAMRDGGNYSDWPPKPPALRAAALDLIRHSPQPGTQLELEGERYDWAEYSKRTYGEVVTLDRAVELSGAAQEKGLAPPSPQNPYRRPDPSPQDAIYEPFPPDADPLPRGSGYEREIEPPPPEIEPEPGGPQVVADQPSKFGGTCDHCRVKVAKGGRVLKVSPACCANPSHQRPSRRSGGTGSWICETCLAEVVG